MKTVLTFLTIIAFTCITYAQIPQYIPTNGLVGYWPFTGNANDESGNGNNRSVNGATLTTDRYDTLNSAYSFDGVNDYLDGSISSILNVDEMTYSCWVYITDTSAQNSIGGSYSNPRGYHIRILNGCVYFKIHNGNLSSLSTLDVSSSLKLSEDQWYFLTFTVDSIYLALYINGQLEDTLSLGSFNFVNQSRLRIGCASWNFFEFFNGKIDDIAIWNRALSPCEIYHLYNESSIVLDTSYQYETNCNLYTWPLNSQTYTTSGQYYYSTTNMYGCDSTIVLDLTIDTVDLSVSVNDPLLTANASSATYQWLICPAYTVISSATYPTYSPMSNGSYACEITQNGCIDTTACYSVVSVGFEQYDNSIQVYPNPTNGFISIDLGETYEEVTIDIFDNLGRLVSSEKYKSTKEIETEIVGEPGVYSLKITTQDFTKTISVSKQ